MWKDMASRLVLPPFFPTFPPFPRDTNVSLPDFLIVCLIYRPESTAEM